MQSVAGITSSGMYRRPSVSSSLSVSSASRHRSEIGQRLRISIRQNHPEFSVKYLLAYLGFS